MRKLVLFIFSPIALIPISVIAILASLFGGCSPAPTMYAPPMSAPAPIVQASAPAPSGPSVAQLKREATDKCNGLVNQYCRRLSVCGPVQNVSVPGEAECRRVVSSSVLDCPGAVAVSSAHPRCLADLMTIPCSLFLDVDGDVTLPAACNGVVLR